MPKPYVMTKSIAEKFQPRCHSQQCGQPIQPGEATISKTNGSHVRKWYHEACYEALFLEL